jgi:hypothetical protein
MRLTTLILALTVPLASLRAQEAAPDSGAEVRITLSPHLEPHRMQGQLVSVDADSLRLLDASSDRVVALLRSQVSLVQVRDGRRNNLVRDATIGTAAGLGAGLAYPLLKSAASEFCPAPQGWQCSSSVEPSPTSEVLLSTAIGGAFGMGIGALVGALTHQDAWMPVSFSQAVALMVRPDARGMGAGLTLRF